MQIHSPLTGRKCENIQASVTDKELVWLYNKKNKVNLKTELRTKEILLFREDDIGFEFFYPFIAGSDEFYSEFYKNRAYSNVKEEYSYSGKFIGQEDDVLDVGCGDGNFSQFMDVSNFNGIDLNIESVQRGQAKGLNISKESIEIHLKRMLANNMKKYDLVTSFQVLEHVEEPIQFILDCLSCLKEEGLLILSVPNNDGHKYSEINCCANLPPHHISRWSLKTFIWLAKKYDLDLVDYHQDSSSLGNYLRFSIVQTLLKKFTGKSKNLITKNPIVLATNLVLKGGMFLLGPILETEIPNISGHSLTVVLKKKNKSIF